MKRSFLFISAVGCGGSLPSFRLPSRRDGRATKVRQCGGILFRLEGRRRWQVCRPAPRAPPLPQSLIHVSPSASPALTGFCFCCKDRASLLPAQKIAPWVRSDSRNEAAVRTKLSISSAFSAPRFFLSPPPFFAKTPRPGGEMADKGRENRRARDYKTEGMGRGRNDKGARGGDSFHAGGKGDDTPYGTCNDDNICRARRRDGPTGMGGCACRKGCAVCFLSIS